MGLSQHNKHKGFTLVELSIVLVVIGLLIGGILAAQSMIATSKINSVAMQIGQFDAGVENFKTKYNYLPGDAPAFGGDGDGIIDFGANTAGGSFTYAVNTIRGENGCFWSSMDAAQFPGYNAYPCTYFPPSANTKGVNKNVPESKLGASGAYFFASALSSGGLAITVNPQNYYAIFSSTQCQPFTTTDTTTSSKNSAVKPVDALALDKKIDDGLPDSGNVIAGKISGGIVAGGISTCTSSGFYLITNPSYECTPLIRIGAQAGDPQ